MNLPPLISGHFVRRDNRFQATVRVDGALVAAHVANSGRLADLFIAERPVWLAPADSPRRKTAYDLKLVELGGVLVSVDARLPNPLFEEALAAGIVSGLPNTPVAREVTFENSRLDFCLGAEAPTWVETKSVTLVEDGVALFPDVPTNRGSRHLRSLMAAVVGSDQAAIVFVVQRPDATTCQPHAAADPVFASTLRQAITAGVGARAFACAVTRRSIAITREIPVTIRE